MQVVSTWLNASPVLVICTSQQHKTRRTHPECHCHLRPAKLLFIMAHPIRLSNLNITAKICTQHETRIWTAESPLQGCW